MAAPVDAYPITTQDGNQIRMDVVRLKALDFIDFIQANGSVVTTAPLEAEGLYVFYANQDCIVSFVGVAVNTPVNASAVFLSAGERVSAMLPASATGFSVIGLTAAGRLYIQRLTAWAGLANDTTLGNQ